MVGPIGLLRPDNVLSQLACILNCVNTDEAIRYAVMSEFIRACVYQSYHGLDDWASTQSVHTTRILSSMRRNIWFLWDDKGHWSYTRSENDVGGKVAIKVLERLGTIGDIVKIGGGFWAPGPIRIVRPECDEENVLLITGGTPIELLQIKFGTRVSCSGSARFLHMDRLSMRQMQIEHELQSLEDWLVWPSEDLYTWTRRNIRSLLANMSVANLEVDGLEIYAPDDLPGKPGQKNWVRIGEFGVVPTGLRLCRPSSGMSALYDRPTYLAELQFRSGRTFFRHVAQVPNDIRLRLMFGFELIKGVYRSVTIEVLGRILRVYIPFKLPEPENRVLEFGWPAGKYSDGRVDVYEFAHDMMPFLIQMMRRLNIQISINGSTEKER